MVDGLNMQRDRLFPPTFDVCAPLLLWALHFFGAYVFAAAGCLTSLADMVWMGRSATWLMLLAWSLVGLLCALWLLIRAVRAWHAMHDASRDRLSCSARVACAALGLTGIAWTSLPLLMLSSCAA
jgi:hypothetical protein